MSEFGKKIGSTVGNVVGSTISNVGAEVGSFVNLLRDFNVIGFALALMMANSVAELANIKTIRSIDLFSFFNISLILLYPSKKTRSPKAESEENFLGLFKNSTSYFFVIFLIFGQSVDIKNLSINFDF